MNYYPGEGLGIGTGAIGNSLGQVYPVGTPLTLTHIYGFLHVLSGEVIGTASTVLSNTATGVIVTPAWSGATITCSIGTASVYNGKIIAADVIITETNEFGYFEFYVVTGLTVTLKCASFGKVLTVNTTAVTEVNVSTLF